LQYLLLYHGYSDLSIGGLPLETVKSTVGGRVRMFPLDHVTIRSSALADKAGLYGAMALAMREGKV